MSYRFLIMRRVIKQSRTLLLWLRKVIRTSPWSNVKQKSCPKMRVFVWQLKFIKFEFVSSTNNNTSYTNHWMSWFSASHISKQTEQSGHVHKAEQSPYTSLSKDLRLFLVNHKIIYSYLNFQIKSLIFKGLFLFSMPDRGQYSCEFHEKSHGQML